MKVDFDVLGEEIYLDNAATTSMAQEVVDEMQGFLEEKYGNPEQPYQLGVEASEAVSGSRENVARLIYANPDRIFFTSGGTESNNWAIKGVSGITRIVTCATEHPSVLRSAESLSNVELVVLPVDSDGHISQDDFDNAVSGDCSGTLVSLQLGNNEIGTIHPIKEMAKKAKESGCIFHVDAVQSYGKIKIDVEDLGIDLMSMSAHKIHGPMGMGALYVAEGVEIDPLIHGGGHELGMRSGTLAVPQIVGFGKAAEMAWSCVYLYDEMHSYSDQIVSGLEGVVDATRNGDKDSSLPHILNITLHGVDASLVAQCLDETFDIAISCGSACSGSSSSYSSVLLALGLSKPSCRSTIRISYSRYTSREEVAVLAPALHRAVADAKRLGSL